MAEEDGRDLGDLLLLAGGDDVGERFDAKGDRHEDADAHDRHQPPPYLAGWYEGKPLDRFAQRSADKDPDPDKRQDQKGNVLRQELAVSQGRLRRNLGAQLLGHEQKAEHDRQVIDRRPGPDRQEPRNGPLDGGPQEEQSEKTGGGEGKQRLFGLPEFGGRLAARGKGDELEQRADQSNQERKSRKDSAGNQRQDARCRVPLAEIGEHVERDDDADEGDDEEIGLEVARDDQERQAFAGGVDPWGLPSRISISCCTRSIGTGKTITVLRSTPIS